MAAGRAWIVYGTVFYDVYIECNSVQDIHELKLTIEDVYLEWKLERSNNEANLLKQKSIHFNWFVKK